MATYNEVTICTTTFHTDHSCKVTLKSDKPFVRYWPDKISQFNYIKRAITLQTNGPISCVDDMRNYIPY